MSFSSLWSDLEPIGRTATGGYRRFAWTREDHTLREWFAGEAAERGLSLVEDRAGNQWAWWGTPGQSNGVVLGSHLDSVPAGGAYDGPLGVVSAFAAVDQARADGFSPSKPVAIVNFGDEEGARFGVACAGSRLITGALAADTARALKDSSGVTMAAARRKAGALGDLGPDPETLSRIGCFVELHVEQGRALVFEDAVVGVGTSIWPHGRWRISVPGRANHAGTTALVDRDDALLKAAALVQAARAAAEENGCVATVGRLDVQPGGVNAIAEHVEVWLDARGASAASVTACVAQIEGDAQALGAKLQQLSWTADTPFDPALAKRLSQLLGAPMLSTGAGHDAGILANAGIPTAMIFVRNPTGVSHAPDEFATPEDCLAGVDALTRVLKELAA
ncbi:allantoate amidohydrolase [Branchiibius sp. NY16-3462-2]|uniref:allantoate amidohydrolase n=1 Tax=Branchiibius sp. NY16-3462-2 TaxID=1807500 RepID=UPI00079CCC73|nr:allantoate amidohydrolase [Branchiibius sp. NY16-3462-2]KYH43398.1 Zn-dependent hydrolase [Branchiibius sp. NY16-3462-2]